MSGIFNLVKVENAINIFRPNFVFVVDTNVLMNTPDHANWRVEGNSALFVVSDTIFIELEHIKSRTERSTKPEDLDTNRKAKALIRNMADLFKSGNIADGIKTDGGWVISVASPINDSLEQELKKIDDIVQAFHRSDAKMLLLTKECNQLSVSDRVTLITCEKNLNNVAQTNEVPCLLHTGFPITDLKVQKKEFSALEWDNKMQDFQSEIKEITVAVGLTLDSESHGSDRVGRQIIVSEGSGIIKEMPENKTFFWTVKFHAGSFNERANHPSEALGIEFDAEIPLVTLDFADEKKATPLICNAIIEKLLECADIPGGNSLQTPDESITAVMGYVLFDEAMNNPPSEEEMEEIMKDPNWGKPISWLDWISDMKEDQKAEYLSLVYSYVHDYWKMGQTYEFRLFV